MLAPPTSPDHRRESGSRLKGRHVSLLREDQ
jgi:hypothetical protein